MERQQIRHNQVKPKPPINKNAAALVKGIALTFFLAILAGQLANIPLLSIMGMMILAIILGGLYGNLFSVPESAQAGITFSSKILLRTGIILLGFRLNLQQIIDAGFSILIIDVIVIAFTMCFILTLGKWFNINMNLAALLAAGTAICGAAAIVALAPIVKSKHEHTAIAVSCIAVLGTIGALLFIFLYPYLPLTDKEYGIMVGASLHELAHVIAGAVPGGDISSDSAVLVKLGRVLLLIPVAVLISYFLNRKKQNHSRKLRDLPVPWFIFGFILMSIINTFQWIPQHIIDYLLLASTYLLAMGMAGLGLNIKWKDFAAVGFKPIAVAVIGFVGLLAISPILLLIYNYL